jgi:hypothetical protein
MPKLFPKDEKVRVHLVLSKSEWKEVLELAEKGSMSGSEMIRSMIFMFLKHTRDQVRTVIDEIERELPPNLIAFKLPEELRETLTNQTSTEISTANNTHQED